MNGGREVRDLRPAKARAHGESQALTLQGELRWGELSDSEGI